MVFVAQYQVPLAAHRREDLPVGVNEDCSVLRRGVVQRDFVAVALLDHSHGLRGDSAADDTRVSQAEQQGTSRIPQDRIRPPLDK